MYAVSSINGFMVAIGKQSIKTDNAPKSSAAAAASTTLVSLQP